MMYQIWGKVNSKKVVSKNLVPSQLPVKRVFQNHSRIYLNFEDELELMEPVFD